MIVLSYRSAKRSLIFMAIYLIIASLIIKGLGYVIEFNFLSSITSLMSFSDLNFKLPDLHFDFDTFSFDGLITFVEDKVGNIVELLTTTIAGTLNTIFIGYVPKIIGLNTKGFLLKV